MDLFLIWVAVLVAFFLGAFWGFRKDALRDAMPPEEET